jgi:hypothetical protein
MADSGENTMLGWLTVFGMMTLGSLATMLIGKAATLSATAASLLFALLFFLCLLTRAVRGRP